MRSAAGGRVASANAESQHENRPSTGQLRSIFSSVHREAGDDCSAVLEWRDAATLAWIFARVVSGRLPITMSATETRAPALSSTVDTSASRADPRELVAQRELTSPVSETSCLVLKPGNSRDHRNGGRSPWKPILPFELCINEGGILVMEARVCPRDLPLRHPHRAEGGSPSTPSAQPWFRSTRH